MNERLERRWIFARMLGSSVGSFNRMAVTAAVVRAKGLGPDGVEGQSRETVRNEFTRPRIEGGRRF